VLARSPSGGRWPGGRRSAALAACMPGMPQDAAAGVGGRAGVVQAGHRGCGIVGEPGRVGRMWNSCSRDSSPWKMFAADQAVLVLHLVRAHDVSVWMIELLKLGATSFVAVDHPVGVGLELLGVRRLVPVRRHPLAEQRHDVVPLRDQRLVERGSGMTPSLNGRTAGRPFRASVKACSMYGNGGRHLDRTRVVFLQVRAGGRR